MSEFRIVLERQIPLGLGQRILKRIACDMVTSDLEKDYRVRIELVRAIATRLHIRFNGDAIGMISDDTTAIRLDIGCAAGYDEIVWLFATKFMVIVNSFYDDIMYQSSRKKDEGISPYKLKH